VPLEVTPSLHNDTFINVKRVRLRGLANLEVLLLGIIARGLLESLPEVFVSVVEPSVVLLVRSRRYQLKKAGTFTGCESAFGCHYDQ
jgi:hypothetical protein